MAGDTTNYTCISGYELVGDSVLTCQVGDVWSPTTPGTCQGGSVNIMLGTDTAQENHIPTAIASIV